MLDCSAVLVQHLKGASAVAALVGTAVHNKRLPDRVGPPGVVVNMLGSATDPDYPEMHIKKFAITCIGDKTANRERAIHNAVADYLLAAGAYAAAGGGKIVAAYQDDSDSSEVESVEEETEWPFVSSKWEVHFIAA